MHIQELRVLGSLSVLGLAATFLISALWVLIEVLFWSACRPGRPIPYPLPSLSPSPITRERSCHWLERWCHAALPCLSRSVLVCLLVPSASITLPFFCGGGFTSICPATFSQDSSGLCWLWVQLQSLVQLAVASMMGRLIEDTVTCRNS